MTTLLSRRWSTSSWLRNRSSRYFSSSSSRKCNSSSHMVRKTWLMRRLRRWTKNRLCSSIRCNRYMCRSSKPASVKSPKQWWQITKSPSMPQQGARKAIAQISKSWATRRKVWAKTTLSPAWCRLHLKASHPFGQPLVKSLVPLSNSVPRRPSHASQLRVTSNLSRRSQIELGAHREIISRIRCSLHRLRTLGLWENSPRESNSSALELKRVSWIPSRTCRRTIKLCYFSNWSLKSKKVEWCPFLTKNSSANWVKNSSNKSYNSSKRSSSRTRIIGQ